MTAPSTTALKPCPFCGGEAESDSHRAYRAMTTGRIEDAADVYCTQCDAGMTWCYRDTPEVDPEVAHAALIEKWNTRATPAPPQDVVEGIAQIVALKCFDPRLIDANGKPFWKQSQWSMARRAATAILASGLVTADEASIRADEREKCERRVEELDCMYINGERVPFGGIPADPESSVRRETIKEACAAIRAGGAK